MVTTRGRDRWEPHRPHLNSICNNNASLRGHQVATPQAHPYRPDSTRGVPRLAHTALGILHRGSTRTVPGLLLLSTLTHIARNLWLVLRGSRCINNLPPKCQPITKGIHRLPPSPSETRLTAQIPLEPRPRAESSQNDKMSDPCR